MIATLRRRNFALLWLGGLVSLIGDQLVLAALPFYIYRLTGSVLQTGAMTIVYFLPSVLLGSVAGVFVDRWHLKRLIVTVNVLQAAGLLPLLLVRSPGTIWIAYVVVLGQSVLSLFMSPAVSAAVPRLVDTVRLSRANALNSMSNNASRLVGPPIGGILLAFAGPSPVILVDAASFLAAALLVALLSVELRGEAPAKELFGAAGSRWAARWSDWARGLSVIRRHHLLLGLLLAGGIGSIADGMLGPLVVPFVRDDLHSNAAIYGLIGAATGLGGLCGAAVIGWIGPKVSPLRLVSLGLLGVGAVALIRYNIVLLPVALFTQQVGSTNLQGLNEWLGAPRDAQEWTLDRARRELEDALLIIVRAEEAFPPTRFREVEAIVYYLKAVPWQIPDFTVPRYLDRQRTLDREIQTKGAVETSNHRFLLIASKAQY